MSKQPVMDEKPEKSDEGKNAEASLGEKLLKTRSIALFEAVTPKVARELVQALILLEADDSKKPIYLYVNSPGGEVNSGFAIYDAIRFIQPEVKVIVSGLCASVATVILVAAKKENRLSLPNSKFLIHQPSISGVAGSTSDIAIVATEINKTKTKVNDLLARETGQPLSRIQEDTDRDFWMDAVKAKEYGLISQIVEHRREMK